MNKDEKAYLQLMQKILDEGVEKKDRTEIGTKSIFGTQLRFDLSNNTLPLLTTKKMFLKGIIEELLFFIRGDYDTKKLEEKNVNIWKGNTSREFLDSRGLKNLQEGSLGLGYGVQWRNAGTQISKLHLPQSERGGVDQLANLIYKLKFTPDDRRMIVSAWNVEDIDMMSLPPCHYNYQCYISNNELSLLWNQRSCDYFLGIPYNITSYAILTHILAKTCGLKAKELIFNGGDTHLYLNHIEPAKTQLSREPYDFPTLQINKELNNIKDIEQLSFKDFEIIGYESYPSIKAEMCI